MAKRKEYTPEQINKSRLQHKEMIERLNNKISNKTEDKIICPMYLYTSRVTVPDKKYALNMNGYRNRNFIVSNDLKGIFKDLISDQLKDLKIEGKFKLRYVIYWSNLLDGANVYSVVDKFLCDAMQEEKCIDNDNINILKGCSWEDGGKDKECPRVEVYIIKE